MKILRWIHVILMLTLLTACGSTSGEGGLPAIFRSNTPTPLPTPSFGKTPAPDAQEPMQVFLDAFKNNDYTTMYGMLTQVSRESISADDFAKTYDDNLNKMSAGSLDYEILSSLVSSPYAAQVSFHITYHTALVGDISRDMVARLSLEAGQWKLQWDSSLILPELTGGNQLAMDYQIPARGDIYDKDGKAIVTQSDAVALGIVPGQINEKSEGTLVSELARLCNLDQQDIRDSYAFAGPDWYIPVCEASVQDAQRILALNPGGLYVTPYNARFYHQNTASQVVGYTQYISPDELDAWRRKGYRGDERVGSAGIEKYAENYLAGQHGGSLYVVDPNGQIISRIASSDPQPASSIYLTIDKDMQYYAQQALTGFRGAIVVLERDTGRVLAMASSPGYDPNLFDPNNYNSNELLTKLLNDPNQPLVNRATQGQYPLGSVFKVVTFSAALESGLFLPETTYDCQYQWTEMTDQPRYDWTWEHCQNELQTDGECRTQPSGLLTLPEGLMRSCNPWFWHIGYDLFNFDRGGDIANMARAFGLGQPTGIEQVAEAAGNITVPGGLVQAVNQAIGQGDVLVTPLQAAVMMAAIGNGGTLYRPQLIEKVVPVSGSPTVVFKPEARGTLPLRSDNLKTLQDALWEVVHNPRGTAQYRLRGLTIPAAGKTGTAESGSGLPHAWFAGYTLASDSTGLPDIAIAVIVENIGEGSDYAAPIFKRMIEVYYLGSPQSLFWWESSFGVRKTPTPIGGIPTKTKSPDD